MEYNKNPLVSVLMTTLDSASFVSEAIDSILAQTYTNWELLVVDGGSTDGTIDILHRYIDQRIRIFIYDGLRRSAQLNIAMKEAQGEYCAIMDSDDISFPQRLQEQLNYMEVHKNVTILSSYAQLFSEKNNQTRLLRTPNSHQDILRSLMTQEAPCFPTLFFLNTQLPLFDERLKKNVDIEWYIRTAKYAIFDNLPIPLVKMRERQGSLSRNPDEENDRLLIAAIEKYCNEQIDQTSMVREKEIYYLWMGIVHYYYGSCEKTKYYLQKYSAIHGYDTLSLRYWLPAAIFSYSSLHKLRRSGMMHNLANIFRTVYRIFR